MIQLKVIDIEFSVCKVKDYSEINLNQEYVFTGATDEDVRSQKRISKYGNSI